MAAAAAASTAAPDVTSTCLPMSPPLLWATSTRPASGAGAFASSSSSRFAVSAMLRRFMPRPCTTCTRWPAAASASPSGRRKVQCS
jgi:hypothetical protein